MDCQSEENWWDQVDMTKVILACNKISEISPQVVPAYCPPALLTFSPQISNLAALQVLDLHDNQLASLPDSLAELGQLTKLNISHNRFPLLPAPVFALKNLRVLQARLMTANYS